MANRHPLSPEEKAAIEAALAEMQETSRKTRQAFAEMQARVYEMLKAEAERRGEDFDMPPPRDDRH